MSVNVQRDLEAKFKACAVERGIAVEEYVETLVRADERPIYPPTKRSSIEHTVFSIDVILPNHVGD